MASEQRPLRNVVASKIRTGRGSVLGPDTWRRMHWWELRLACGHVVERPARYPPRSDRHLVGAPRFRDEALPAPRRARCGDCGRGSDGE